MTDVPHDTPQAARVALRVALGEVGVGITDDAARQVLAALSAAGYRVIRTDQLEHGDELASQGATRVGTRLVPLFALRRVLDGAP